MVDHKRKPRVELEIVRGQTRAKRRPIDAPAFLMGASPDCDLVLRAAGFPDVYAYLIVHAGDVSVRHLGFAPELRVNDAAVTGARLANGDRLSAGPYEFTLHVARSNADATLPVRVQQMKTGVGAEKSDSAGLEAASRLRHDIRALLARSRAIRRPA